MTRRFAIVALCVAVAPVVGATSASAAATLPPQLVAKLEADRTQAEQALERERTALGEVAAQQRVVAGAHARVVARDELLARVADLVGARVPGSIDERSQAAVDAWQARLDEVDSTLDAATERTSTAQGAALDADRRLRALQRASQAEDEVDTSLGSWRFGSGGPPVGAESVDRYLQSKGSPMAGAGAAFVEAGVEYEVDPRLLVAIAGAESYFGVTTCASYNAWGWGCPTRPQSFDDWAHAIRTVAKGLREGYLDDGLETVGEIHLRYAPPNAKNDPTGLNFAWPDNVARFLVEQGGDPQHVAGVVGPSR